MVRPEEGLGAGLWNRREVRQAVGRAEQDFAQIPVGIHQVGDGKQLVVVPAYGPVQPPPKIGRGLADILQPKAAGITHRRRPPALGHLGLQRAERLVQLLALKKGFIVHGPVVNQVVESFAQRIEGQRILQALQHFRPAGCGRISAAAVRPLDQPEDRAATQGCGVHPLQGWNLGGGEWRLRPGRLQHHSQGRQDDEQKLPTAFAAKNE